MFIKLGVNIMPFEATPYIFYTTDIIYMVAMLSPEMGFTLTLSVCVCVCVCVCFYVSHACSHPSIYSFNYLSVLPSMHPTYPNHIPSSIHPFIFLSNSTE